jgi:hypothetical protein
LRSRPCSTKTCVTSRSRGLANLILRGLGSTVSADRYVPGVPFVKAALAFRDAGIQRLILLCLLTMSSIWTIRLSLLRSPMRFVAASISRSSESHIAAFN